MRPFFVVFFILIMKQKMSKFKDMVLSLMFPSGIKCMFCANELNQNSYNTTCENCLEVLPFIKNPCEKCGATMNSNQQGVCLKCKSNNLNFSQARSVFEYKDSPLIVVHNLKYNGKKYLVKYIVKYLLDIYSTWNVFADIVTCVPMFELKEKARGYNQSKLLAEEFSLNAKLPFYELCAKAVDTPSQTELNTQERMNNVADSFVLKKEFKKTIKGKTILIIDDVITTGATTSEISKTLINAGAKDCYVLSFAHTKLEQLNFEAN